MRNNKDVDSLGHTTWRCQYHVVFAPKYRRMIWLLETEKAVASQKLKVTAFLSLNKIPLKRKKCPVENTEHLAIGLILLYSNWGKVSQTNQMKMLDKGDEKVTFPKSKQRSF